MKRPQDGAEQLGAGELEPGVTVLEILDGELEIERGHHDTSFDLSSVVLSGSPSPDAAMPYIQDTRARRPSGELTLRLADAPTRKTGETTGKHTLA